LQGPNKSELSLREVKEIEAKQQRLSSSENVNWESSSCRKAKWWKYAGAKKETRINLVGSMVVRSKRGGGT